MKIAGKRTSPSEVEGLILEDDDIIEAAAVGVKDPVKGQAIVCACVPAPGVSESDALKERISSRVAWREMASMTPISSPQRSIMDTTPEVDKVIRRFDSDRPSLSLTISMAAFTLSTL